MLEDYEAGYRAKIILLKDEGYTVPEIRMGAINHHDTNIRKWMQHRFNEKGIEGIISKIHKHKSIWITDDKEKKIVKIATKNPRLWVTLFNMVITYTCRICIKGTNLVDSISHTEIRNILLKHGTKCRKSKTVLSNKSNDSEYALKKRELKN